MKTLKTLALATAVSAGLLGAGGVMAATDGQLGTTTSSGDFRITLSNVEGTKIWGLKDIQFSFDGVSTTTLKTSDFDFCVFSNASSTPTYKYDIERTDTTHLSNGSDSDIFFDVDVSDDDGATYVNIWDGENSAATTKELAAGYLGDQPDPTVDTDCTGVENANVKVTIPASQAVGSAGIYAGLVTLQVTAK